MYFIYTLNQEADEPIVLIDKHIGSDPEDGMGIMGDQCAREIMALDEMGKKRIQVWINSVGGTVMDAMSIYNAILKSKTKVDTYNVGIAASSADLIFQAGRKRIMNDYALRMMHNPFGGDGADEDMVASFKQSTMTMIAARCGQDVKVVDSWMNATTWMNASTSLSNNLCDEIQVSSDYNKKRMSGMTDAKSMWQAASKILNKVIDDNKTIKMEKVYNHLKLNKEASEDAMLEAIKGIENRATAAEASAADIQNKLTAKEAELLEVQNKVTEFEAKAAQAETEAKTVKAKAFVAELVKAGKIKNEASETWEKNHISDPEGTESMAKGLTANIEAPKQPEDKINVSAPYNMAVAMHNINSKTTKN